MVQVSKRTELQQFLLRYYQIQWLRLFNRGLYFFIEILLFMFLTYLPIKITFNYQLQDGIASGSGVQGVIVVMFFLHIYLYLDHKVKKLVENPQIKKKVLFRTYVVKLKWLNLITPQLIYDTLCLLVAFYQLIADQQNAYRILELIYLPKVYKIKMFHDRFLSYIIGTPFYIIYNVFYGLFILIIIVSYVGCLFFEIDSILYNSNYPYPDLLWVQDSAWPTIIEDGFHIQLLYTMYWSLGTASSAAYGNVAAAAPEDIIYNILCLYFEGFLFGFYLSRIHSLPEMLTKKEDELLQIFQQFEEHKDAIKKSDKNEKIEKDLYFKILCSLEYRQYRKKNVSEIEKLLPKDYLIQIKTHVFKSFLDTDPLNLWPSISLQEKLSLKIQQTTTEVGQQVYQYGQVSRNDLIYIKQGDVMTSIVIDSIAYFTSMFRSGQFFGMFQFATGFVNYSITAVCKNYCNLYRISREDYKELLEIKERVMFDQIGSSIRSFQNKITQSQSIGLFQSKLNLEKSFSVFLTGEQKCNFVSNLLISKSQKYSNNRKSSKRSKFQQSRIFVDKNPTKKNIAIQCDEQDHCLRQIDQVIIL